MRGFLPLILGAALCACRPAGPSGPDPIRTPASLEARFLPPEGYTVVAAGLEPGALRYGVMAPGGATRASVILLAGRNEPSEAFAETVRDLSRNGLATWVVEPGDERMAVADLEAFIRRTVRPGRTGFVLAASGGEAALALQAAERTADLGPKTVLWSPALSPPDDEDARSAIARGMGDAVIKGAAAWTRPQRVLAGRGDVVEAWRVANPSLRPPLLTWRRSAADAELRRRVLTQRFSVPIEIHVDPGGRAAAEALCAGASRCHVVPARLAGPHPAFAPDLERAAWLEAVMAVAEVHGP